MDGMVVNIQRFSTHDGPGIRTTVFFKGCNLHCFWCHNPESIHACQEIQFFPRKCIGCGKCFEVCPFNVHEIMEGNRLLHREKCSKCGKCTKVCCSGALVMAGKMMTVEEIVAEVEKDRPFYKNSGGGVTFSGGEPLLQKDFLKALLAECKSRGIHTAVESAINVPWKWLEEIQPYVDLFLVDVKLIDEEKHKQVTGVSNARILENLVKLAEAVCELWIRVPVIPEVNDNIEEIGKIAELVKGLKKVKLIELVPFHGMAKGKYESLGMDYKAADYNPPTDDLMNKLNSILKVKGFTAV